MFNHILYTTDIYDSTSQLIEIIELCRIRIQYEKPGTVKFGLYRVNRGCGRAENWRGIEVTRYTVTVTATALSTESQITPCSYSITYQDGMSTEKMKSIMNMKEDPDQPASEL